MQIGEFIGQISLKKGEQQLLTQSNSLLYVESGKVQLFAVKLNENNDIVDQVLINCDVESFFSFGEFYSDLYTYAILCKASEDSQIDVMSFDEAEDKEILEEFIETSVKENIVDWINNFVSIFEDDKEKLLYLIENISLENLVEYNSKLMAKIKTFYFDKAEDYLKREIYLKKNQTKLITNTEELYYLSSGGLRFFLLKLDENEDVNERYEIHYNDKVFFSLGIEHDEKFYYTLEIQAIEDSNLQLLSFANIEDKQSLDDLIKTELKSDIINWFVNFAFNFTEELIDTEDLCENISLDFLQWYLPMLLPQMKSYCFAENTGIADDITNSSVKHDSNKPIKENKQDESGENLAQNEKMTDNYLLEELAGMEGINKSLPAMDDTLFVSDDNSKDTKENKSNIVEEQDLAIKEDSQSGYLPDGDFGDLLGDLPTGIFDKNNTKTDDSHDRKINEAKVQDNKETENEYLSDSEFGDLLGDLPSLERENENLPTMDDLLADIGVAEERSSKQTKAPKNKKQASSPAPPMGAMPGMGASPGAPPGGGGMPGGMDLMSSLGALFGMPGAGGAGPQQEQQPKGLDLSALIPDTDSTQLRKKTGDNILEELDNKSKGKSSKKDGSYIAKTKLKENESITLHERDKLWYIEDGEIRLFVQKIDEYGKQLKRFPIPCGDIKLFFSLGMKEATDGYFYVLEAIAEKATSLSSINFDDVDDKKELNNIINEELKDEVLAWLRDFASLFETDADMLRRLNENLTSVALSEYNAQLLDKIKAFYDMGDEEGEDIEDEKSGNDFVRPMSIKANEKIALLELDRLWFLKTGDANLFLIKTDSNDEVVDRLAIPFDEVKLFFSLGKIEVDGFTYSLELAANKDSEFDTIYFDEVDDKALLDNFVKTSIRNELIMWILVLSKIFRADISQTDHLCENLSLDALLAFNSRVLPQLQAYYERERKTERKRRKDKVLRDQEKYSESFYNLTERLISGKAREAFYDMNVEGKSSNLVYKACVKVFKSKKIKIKEPPSAREENVTNEEMVRDIANSSGVQYRTVTLEHNWHLKSGASMLCFRKSDRAPLAMIQIKSSRYKMYDPKNNRTVKVTDDIAKEVEKQAVTFYKPLPNKPMKLNDVISFIFQTASKKDFAIVIILGLLGGLLNLIVPMMTRQIVDDIIPSADNSSLVYVAGLLVLLGFTQFCFDLTESFASMRFETMSELELTAGMWDRLVNLPVRFIKQWPAGEVMAKINGITQIRNALSSIVVNTFMSGIFSLSYFILMFSYSWQLALVGVAVVAVLVIISLTLTKMQLKFSGRLIDLGNRLEGKNYGWVAGIPKIKIAGAERRVFHNWTKIYGDILKFTIKRTKISNVSMVFNSVIQIVISMILFLTMCKLTYKGLTVGEFVAFNSAFGSLMSNVLSLCGTIITVNFIVPIYGRLRPFLENVPEYEDNMEDPGEITGDITFSNVTFSYNYAEKRTIEGLSFHIKSGEYVGVVGPSGAGKSTLVKLLIGFNKPSFGEILYDGLSLDKVDKRRVRRQLGVVLQEGSLMAGSIFDNIAGVNMKLTQEQAWDAARRAGLDKEIKKMPMGMQTPIMEGGSTLSGGQRQRILIARALASSPKVFIFDEATSALDNRTQDIVTESIGRLGVTRIVIAHRLSTIMNCDKILVMDGGKVVEEGDYQTLMNNKGLFFQMAQKQLAESE